MSKPTEHKTVQARISAKPWHSPHATSVDWQPLSKNITGPVYVEFKHNWSHAHSSPDLFHVHGGPLSVAYWNPPPTRHKVVWTMRNEDMFILRWGQPWSKTLKPPRLPSPSPILPDERSIRLPRPDRG